MLVCDVCVLGCDMNVCVCVCMFCSSIFVSPVKEREKYVCVFWCGGFSMQRFKLWALMQLEELSASWVRKIYDLMSMDGWEHSHATRTQTHMCTHVCTQHTHSEMSGILPSASLTVSMASMASMVAEGWARETERERGGSTERERRWQSPREKMKYKERRRRRRKEWRLKHASVLLCV